MSPVLAYVCVRCGTRLGDGDWCPTCRDKVLAERVATSQPEPISDKQRITICVLFRELGVVNGDAAACRAARGHAS